MKKLLLFVCVIGLSGLMATAQTFKDPDTYAPTASGEKLTNLYLNSYVLSNKVPVYPGGVTGDYRGMAVLNDKMYFSGRDAGTVNKNPRLIEVDGITGAFVRRIDLPMDMWKLGTDTLPYLCNDIQVDNAGHLIVSNMVLNMNGTGPSHTVRLNYVDVSKTPIEWKTLMDASLSIPTDLVPDPFRPDAFDVYGDIVNGNGFVMMGFNSGVMPPGNIVVKINFTGGVADVVNIETIELKGMTASGTAPRINIVDNSLFYFDTQNGNPTLYYMNGNVADGFMNNTALGPLGNGQNGVEEFEMNGNYYLVVASTNTDKTPPQAFDIFKFKDANRLFKDMEFLYRFPTAGMGAYSNGVRTALPRVEVLDAGNGKQKARINLYAYQNGYGIYEFTQTETGLFNNTISTFKYSVEGRQILVNEEVKSITLYSVTGQKLNESFNNQTIQAPSNGVFVVKVTNLQGTVKVAKIAVK